MNRTRANEWKAVMANWLEWKTSLDRADYFSDDEYGLLNTAKFAINEFVLNVNRTKAAASAFTPFEGGSSKAGGGNETFFEMGEGGTNSSGGYYLSDYEFGDMTPHFNQADVIAQSPSLYSLPAIVIIACIITAMMIVIVVGNMLVIIAIATENNLTTVQNWFIASLAVADMSIGLIVMPFSLSYELMGYWMFGPIWCEVHAALDVLLCTSSIMNICLISLDRYWSITKAISYLNQRTPTRVTAMIVIVWILSALISIPPLMGWKDSVDLDWFWEILDERGNRTQMEFLQDLEESGRLDLNNFTTTLETIVYPQCLVSSIFHFSYHLILLLLEATVFQKLVEW